MNLNQNFSITFRLNHSKKNSKGLTPIWCRITIDGKRSEFSTSKQVLKEYWDVENNKVSMKCVEANLINDFLENIRVEIRKRYNVLLASERYITAEDIVKNYKGESEKLVMFLEMFEQFYQMQFERM